MLVSDIIGFSSCPESLSLQLAFRLEHGALHAFITLDFCSSVFQEAHPSHLAALLELLESDALSHQGSCDKALRRRSQATLVLLSRLTATTRANGASRTRRYSRIFLLQTCLSGSRLQLAPQRVGLRGAHTSASHAPYPNAQPTNSASLFQRATSKNCAILAGSGGALLSLGSILS